MEARAAALAALGRDRPAQGFQAPGAEETQFRARQAQRPAPPAQTETAAPVVTPPPGRGADVLRTMSDEELAAQGPLGSTPPPEASAAARPGVPAPLPLDIIKRELERTAPEAMEGSPRAQEAPGEAIGASRAPEPRSAEPSSVDRARAALRRLASEYVVATSQKIHMKTGRNLGMTPEQHRAYDVQHEAKVDAVLRDLNDAELEQLLSGTNRESRAEGRSITPNDDRGAPDFAARELMRRESAEAASSEAVPAGAPHDQAAVQEGLFGEQTLAGKEQAELLPETAGQPTAKLKAEKIAPEEVGRVQREGAEPAGERPAALPLEGRPGEARLPDEAYSHGTRTPSAYMELLNRETALRQQIESRLEAGAQLPPDLTRQHQDAQRALGEAFQRGENVGPERKPVLGPVRMPGKPGGRWEAAARGLEGFIGTGPESVTPEDLAKTKVIGKRRPERITAATYTAKSGKVYEGQTHDQAFAKGAAAGEPELHGYPEIDREEPDQDAGLALEDRAGFRTSRGRVVDREEAGKIAERADQLTREGEEARALTKRAGLDAVDLEPSSLPKSKNVARHAELTAQIARDEQITGAGTSQSTFTDVGGHIGQPGQKFTRTFAKGPAYAARGRLAQARKRLADLEKTMAPDELAQARAAATEAGATVAQETSERIAQGGKTSAQLEREGIERESEGEKPDYEALAAKQAGPIPPAMKDLIHQRLIEYGDTKEELDGLPPLELANRALEREVLSPSEETRLLDAVWPDMGALLRARRKGAPIPQVTVPQRSVRDEFRKQLYPEKRGPEAQVAGRLLRRAIGEMRRDKAIYRQELKDARRLPGVDLSTPAGIEWYDLSERPGTPDVAGLTKLDPKLQEATRVIRSLYAGLIRDIQALGTGKLEMPIENYMGHGWKDPEAAKKVYRELSQSQARRPLAGSKAFLKERTIPRLVDGLRRGLEPITKNGVDLNLWKMDQMRKYLFAQRFMQDAKGEGIARFFRVGENLPDGWGRVEDPTFAVYGRTEAGELVLRGHWGMPTTARDLVMNYLSPGLRGNPIANAWLGAANSMVQWKLGASGFHAGFSTYTGAISRVALAIGKMRTGRAPAGPPTKGDVLGGAAGAAAGIVLGGPGGAGLGLILGGAAGRLLQKGLALKAVYLDPGAGTLLEQRLADLMARAGGQAEMPGEYRTATVQALKAAARSGNLPKAVAHTLALALQSLAWPTMQFYVPLIKMGAFSDLMQAEAERLGPLATEAQVDAAAQRVWHSIDNRFGQVSYDTRFWNNALKHVMMGTIQAVGWDAGTVDELVGGLKDGLGGKPSPRLDFLLALPLTVALIGILTQYALTGEGPSSVQDVFEPRNGKVDEFGNPERVTPATYMKDILGFIRHPVNTAVNKLNPLIGFLGRLLSNRDFYGNKWRNENDPVTDQLKQSWKFVRDEWAPISVKNVQEERRRGVTGGGSLLPMVGITPASREAVRTKAQNLMIQMLRERTPARTPEEQEAALAKREERQGLSPEQRLVGMFRKLSPDQRHQVYAAANEREREMFGPYVERRMKAYRQ